MRAIILRDDDVLVQRPADAAAGGNYAFIGGEYEFGDTIESRLRQELAEEITVCVTTWRYLFVVENRFVHDGHRVHGLEHYVSATIDAGAIESREGHLVQEWLPLGTLAAADLRPHAVRDVLAKGTHEQTRHLVIAEW